MALLSKQRLSGVRELLIESAALRLPDGGPDGLEAKKLLCQIEEPLGFGRLHRDNRSALLAPDRVRGDVADVAERVEVLG